MGNKAWMGAPTAVCADGPCRGHVLPISLLRTGEGAAGMYRLPDDGPETTIRYATYRLDADGMLYVLPDPPDDVDD